MLMVCYRMQKNVKIMTNMGQKTHVQWDGDNVAAIFMNTTWAEVLKVCKIISNVNWYFLAEMSPEDIFEMFFGSGFGRSINRRQTNFFSHSQRPQQNAQREDTVI